VLGSSLIARTGQFNGRLEQEVQRLWGAPHPQVAADAWILRPGVETEVVETKKSDGQPERKSVTRSVMHRVPAVLESTRVLVDLDLEHRQRGLLWYPTYTVQFKATYIFRNPDPEPRQIDVRLPLPASDALYDNFLFSVDGRPSVPIGDVSKEMTATATADAGGTTTLDVQYRSRGLRTWTYAF